MTVQADTIIRTIVLALALINQFCTMRGHSLIPISDEQVAELVTLLITIGSSVWAWWKNNSFTQAALEADEVMRELKDRKKTEV